MLLVLFLLLNVVDGMSLAKIHNSSVEKIHKSDLISQIMTSKDNPKDFLSLFADADPARLKEVISLLDALLAASRAELTGLTTTSHDADTAYDNAVAAHNAAIVDQTNGLAQLQSDLDAANVEAQATITAAQLTYDQGVSAFQATVDATHAVVVATTAAKTTANSVLANDQSRLDSEIATLIQVIALMEGLLGINTFAPTASPTTHGIQVRISDGVRAEIYYNGQWGTICDDHFDDRDVLVFCRSLPGCDASSSSGIVSNDYVPDGNHLPILADDFYCTGSETNLIYCSATFGDGNHNCAHSEDAGVVCYNQEGHRCY